MTLARLLRFLFFVLLVRPLIYVILGLNVRRWERLPADGPAVIVANHNSHLDTLVLMSLLPLALLPKIRPVAAADYFLRNRVLAWFAKEIVGIIPVSRTGAGGNPLAGSFEALRRGDILILFPEGSRGEPERMQGLKQGIRIIARKFPEVPVVPVYLHGLGMCLPRGEAFLVPHICDVFVGEPLTYGEGRGDFVAALEASLTALAEQGHFPDWQ